MRVEEIILCFFVYGFVGWCTEVAFSAVKRRKFVNRGFLNGPICPIYGFGILSVILILADYQDNIIKLYCMSAIVVTLLEWVTGVVLEKLFHHKWWDYSNEPFNIQGHICLPFSLAWGIACVIVIRYVHPFTLKWIRFIPNVLEPMIIMIVLVAFIADVYVTVHEICKLNVKLKKMQDLAVEMEEFSVCIGKKLSENVISTVEKQEMMKKKLEEKFQEQFSNLSYTNKRLLRAFPRMESLKYKKQLQAIKEYLAKKKLKKNYEV